MFHVLLNKSVKELKHIFDKMSNNQVTLNVVFFFKYLTNLVLIFKDT